MSQQRFSDIHRQALWEAHRKRCLYCKKPLLFKELIIDHVIPEKTAKDDNQLARLRVTHGLGVDFDIAGDENLAPACHACNTAKTDHLLSPEYAALILTQVAARLPKIDRLKTRYQKQASDDDVMLGVSVALEKVSSRQQRSETSCAGMRPAISRSICINRFNSSAAFPWRHSGGRKWTGCSTSRSHC